MEENEVRVHVPPLAAELVRYGKRCIQVARLVPIPCHVQRARQFRVDDLFLKVVELQVRPTVIVANDVLRITVIVHVLMRHTSLDTQP